MSPFEGRGALTGKSSSPTRTSVTERPILMKTARRLCTRGPLPHAVIAARSAGWSAAELAQIWSEAALLAVQDRRKQIYKEDYVGGFERVSHYRNRTRAVRPTGSNR